MLKIKNKKLKISKFFRNGFFISPNGPILSTKDISSEDIIVLKLEIAKKVKEWCEKFIEETTIRLVLSKVKYEDEIPNNDDWYL